MSKLQRLVLKHKDGTSEFIIRDENAPAFDEAQNKTDEEKAQARQNIDAGGSMLVVILTFGDDGAPIAASHNAQQIYDHVQAGGTAVLYHEEIYYTLRSCDPGYATFEHHSDDDFLYTYKVWEDGSVTNIVFQLFTEQAALNFISAPPTAKVGQTIVVKSVDSNGKPTAWEAANLPSGGIAPLYVTFDEDTQTASHITHQIYDHVRSGGDVFWQAEGFDAPLTYCSSFSCLFTEISAEEGYMRQLCVYEDGTGEEFTFTFAASAFLNNKITAPSTAQVGQTIVVKSVDSNGKPTAWEAADFPNSGIVVAKFYSYDDIRISCSTHTAEQLYNILNDDEMPVIAYVYDEDRGKNITAVCWTKGDSQICVGEPFGENGWMFDLANYNQSNFVNEQPDHTIGNELWLEM